MVVFKPKILVIYDSSAPNDFFVKGYESRYTILEAPSLSKAIELNTQYKNEIAAVIINDNVESFDVLQLLFDLRKLDVFRRTPVILLTSNKNDEFLTRAFSYDIFDAFFKPVDLVLSRCKLSKIIELFVNRNQLEKFFNQQMTKISIQDFEIEENQWRIIETLGQALESRDVESGNHCNRMKDITETFLKFLAVTYPKYMITDLKIDQITKVTSLHDIGKIAIPDRILLKPESEGRLTSEEFEVMKTHTVAGSLLLNSIPNFQHSDLYKYGYNIIRYHHERWDGAGYPDKMKGNDIPIEAQVVAIADVFDALLSKRIYKPSFTLEKTKEMINSGECGSFNPDILHCFNNCADSLYDRIYKNSFKL